MPTVYFVIVTLLLSSIQYTSTYTESTIRSSVAATPTTLAPTMNPTSKATTAENATSFTWNSSKVSAYVIPTTVVLSSSSLTANKAILSSMATSSTMDKTIASTNPTTMIQTTSVYIKASASPTRPTNDTMIVSILSTANISLTALTSPLITVSVMEPLVPVTSGPTEVQGNNLLLPLFYTIALACVGATLLLGLIALLLSLLCLRLRGKRKKRTVRRRRDSERVSLCNLNRTNSSGSSHSSVSGQQMSIVNTTDVVLRANSGRNHTDSLNSRGSKLGLWFNKGSLRPLSAHNPGVNCTTFKPNQQLYLPHIQVQVHVNNDIPAPFTPESRVGSYCQLDEDETKKPISLKATRPSSVDSASSIVGKMLSTR